jgi:pimeloyl-ACP methyl ester carboxylesterase
MTLFALLHGGLHHGSCWRQVKAELEFHGHHVVAPDLPVDDDSAGAVAWAHVAIDAIVRDTVDGAPEDTIVVGHSISGLCLPVMATMWPVRRMVFIGGLLPVPGQTFVEHLATNPDAMTFPEPQAGGSGPNGLTWESVRDGFYHDCPEPVARSAFRELRNQSFTVLTEVCPINAWPPVPSTYILMRDDRAIGQRWARHNAAERVGAAVVEMEGGHSPFFARPAELANVLRDIASANSDCAGYA